MAEKTDRAVNYLIQLSTISSLNRFARQFPKLTKDDQLALGRIIRDENATDEEKESAKLQLIVSGFGLIAKIAFYSTNQYQNENRIANGLLGLVRAVNKYDPSRGCAFSTSAYYWVRKMIFEGDPKERELVRMGRDTQKYFSAISKLENDAQKEFGPHKYLTDQEIAAKLKISVEKVHKIRRESLN